MPKFYSAIQVLMETLRKNFIFKPPTPRKWYFTIVFTIVVSFSFAQLGNGGLHGKFAIDADTRAGVIKYGPSTGSITSDDWFGPTSGDSRGLIDTSNSNFYKTLLQANRNISFTKKMALPLYSKVNGTTWLDAIYHRDYITGSSNDSTSFLGANNNGEDPANWSGGVSSIPVKNDFIDVYAHLRRNGYNVTDSLWFYTGVSTMGASGNRLFDIELYKNKVTYSAASGKFSTGGPSAGHSEWEFDAFGNITQTGDLIISVAYAGGGVPPTIEVRIWVSKTTHLTAVPTLFNFGSNFDGASAFSAYGYANIVSKSGGTTFGSGIGNYSAIPAADTTYSTPWGTNLSGAWVADYSHLQFVEIGINLTRIGIDPALYAGLGMTACDATFKTIFFKSRASTAFSSALQDFAGPVAFLHPPLDHTIQSDTLSCNQTTGILRINNNSGFLTWSTINGGNITGANADSSEININKPGKYIVSASAASGCAIGRRDTITVTADSIQPTATAGFAFAAGPHQFQLRGGDPDASNANTPYGNSQGLTWNWSGPSGFTSNLQNPYVTKPNGTYRLIITEARNGCMDTASIYINFTLLHPANFKLTGQKNGYNMQLKWTTPATDIITYHVERMTNGTMYQTIGVINSITNSSSYSFTDNNISTGTYTYRIKAITQSGSFYYSNSILSENIQSRNLHLKLTGETLNIIGELSFNEMVGVSVYNTTGQLLANKFLTPGRVNNLITLEKKFTESSRVLIISIIQKNVINTQKIFVR